MPKIMAKPQEIEGRADTIKAGAENIFSRQNEVTKIFMGMGHDFSGRIPSLMTERMIAMEDEYRSINTSLMNYQDFLRKVAQAMESTDSEAARWVASLE